MSAQRFLAYGQLVNARAELRRLERHLSALEVEVEDPEALAYVDLAISALERLQDHLEAPEKVDGERLNP